MANFSVIHTQQWIAHAQVALRHVGDESWSCSKATDLRDNRVLNSLLIPNFCADGGLHNEGAIHYVVCRDWEGRFAADCQSKCLELHSLRIARRKGHHFGLSIEVTIVGFDDALNLEGIIGAHMHPGFSAEDRHAGRPQGG